MLSYQYRDPHDRYIINMGIPYLEKTVFILIQGPECLLTSPDMAMLYFANIVACQVKVTEVFIPSHED